MVHPGGIERAKLLPDQRRSPSRWNVEPRRRAVQKHYRKSNLCEVPFGKAAIKEFCGADEGIAMASIRAATSRLVGSEARALAYGSPCGGFESRLRVKNRFEHHLDAIILPGFSVVGLDSASLELQRGCIIGTESGRTRLNAEGRTLDIASMGPVSSKQRSDSKGSDEDVVLQKFTANVYDVYVIRGNSALLRCYVPPAVKDYVRVTSWVRDDGVTVGTLGSTGIEDRYLMLPTGELLIRGVQSPDTFRGYRCQVRNVLTGVTDTSATAGKVIVT
ncbi:hypothetical protein HPB47_010959, partial [Ixodes persulcatus]